MYSKLGFLKILISPKQKFISTGMFFIPYKFNSKKDTIREFKRIRNSSKSIVPEIPNLLLAVLNCGVSEKSKCLVPSKISFSADAVDAAIKVSNFS